jgi:hypothetical protein
MGLFLLVSLQVATMLRPVLLRKPGGGVFVTGKKSFLEQMWYVFDKDETVPLKPAPKPEPKKVEPAKAAPAKPGKAAATGKPAPGPTPPPKPGATTPQPKRR